MSALLSCGRRQQLHDGASNDFPAVITYTRSPRYLRQITLMATPHLQFSGNVPETPARVLA
jgi:hypothetical protein